MINFNPFKKLFVTNVTVSVTKDNIFYGEPFGTSSCPIALALNSILDQHRVAYSVFNNVVICFIGENTKKLILPIEARSFIKDFDSQKAVQPFNFQLVVPKKLLK